jgi:SAM-dependent methyltransferase
MGGWIEEPDVLDQLFHRDSDMSDRPITGDDARLYVNHVASHGLHDDIRWLLDVGRFPVGCCVLDVGCGTGTLVAALAADKQFARSVIGVELSQELAHHACSVADGSGGTVVQSDFLSWSPPAGWKPDTAIMSFYLHHCEDAGRQLRRAAALLPHGGRLYVLDRIALDQAALNAFPRFWEEQYRSAHEWAEDMPRLMTASGLIETAALAGFTFVRQQVCPHDRRAGAERFPKTLMEFWRQEAKRGFPAILVVSPAHGAAVDEITQHLERAGLQLAGERAVPYTDDLIRTIYDRCPWREPLLRFVGEVCPVRNATALPIAGDAGTPALLARLGEFKKAHRDRWQNIEGPVAVNGFRAIILPFHVPEPYEAEALARVVGLPAEGC